MFVRFLECNLNCSWCDTQYAQCLDYPATDMTYNEICQEILNHNCKLVTFTGGEPLLNGIDFIKKFATVFPDIECNIETNGSIREMLEFTGYPNVVITADYKCTSSGVKACMLTTEFEKLRNCDAVKFVVADEQDLVDVIRFLTSHHIKAQKFIHAVFGKISLETLAMFVKNHSWAELRLGVQLHKLS